MKFKKPNSRQLSWIATISAVLSPLVLYLIGFYDPPDVDGYVCGLYILGPLFMTFFLVGVLGVIGLLAGIKNYRNRPGQKTLPHKVELLAHFIPLALVAAFIVMIFVG
ncbi:MAG: hypothetical protein EHM45_23000 [Desulfobacteraceae bacterium]|nr:MAG: hypothetical protein EHM45_23000 [Desulfobacteraceae bacterium]